MNSRNNKSKSLKVSFLTLFLIVYSCSLSPLNVVAQPILLKVQLLFPVESGGELDTLSVLTTQAKLVTVQGRTFVLVGEFTDAKVAFRLGKSLQRRVKLPFELSYDPGHPQANFAWLRELENKESTIKSVQLTPPARGTNTTQPTMMPVVKKATKASSLPSFRATDLLPPNRQLLATSRIPSRLQTTPRKPASNMVRSNSPAQDSAQSNLSSDSIEAKLRPGSDPQATPAVGLSPISDSIFLSRSQSAQTSVTVLQPQISAANPSSPAPVSESRPSSIPTLIGAIASKSPKSVPKPESTSRKSTAASFKPLPQLAVKPAAIPTFSHQTSETSISAKVAQIVLRTSGFTPRVQRLLKAKPSLTSEPPLVVITPPSPALPPRSHTQVNSVILGDVVMPVSKEPHMLAVNPELTYLYIVLGEAAEAEAVNKLTPVVALHLHDGQILAQVGVFQADPLGRRMLDDELNQLSNQGFTIRLIHRGEAMAISQGGLPKPNRHV